MKLRQWQSECVNRALEHFKAEHRHFLCLATPGAGKTIMAAEVAAQLFEEDLIDFVLCFSPSINISQGIKSAFSKRFDCRFDGVIGAIGCSYTYQSMLSFKQDFWQLLKRNRVLVVFDEIHHCSGSSLENANAWGEEILLNLQNQAAYTLALTGTPWRSDLAPIALSRYTDPHNRIQCDYIYGLREAITDGVCRSPKIVFIDNEKISVSDQDNETKTFNCLDDLFKGSSVSYQSVIENDLAVRYALKQATNKLNNIRQYNHNAAGLVVASSVEHATHILEILRKEFAQTAEIVTYKEQRPLLKIDRFRNGTTNWIVSVGMISEGTDIPRLQVCCHLSRVKTELYFRQVLGRVLRKNNSRNQEAWLYTFAAPKLVEFARRLAEEIPDIPVVFRQSIETITSQGTAKDLSLQSKDIFSTTLRELNLSSAYLDGQVPAHFAELIPLEHSSSATSLSLELLGGFREKVVSTFRSPF
jgi:superfamily II DNA or RNA helicase